MHPEVVKRAEILEGVGMETAPPLRGYVRFQTRPTADADSGGRTTTIRCWCAGSTAWAAARCSLPTPRTAGPRTGSPGPASTGCGPTSSATCCRTRRTSETTADFDRAANELVVDYRLARNVPEPAAVPDIYAFGPNGFQAPLKVAKVAAGHYRGRLAIGRTRDCSACGRWPIRAPSRKWASIGRKTR